MPTLQQILDLAEKDPVRVYVGITIAAARKPSPAVIVPLAGREIILPDWTGNEWEWYGSTAISIAERQTANGPQGSRDKDRAQSRLALLITRMQSIGNAKPTPLEIADFYDASVRLVIASTAAAFGPSRYRLAAEAIGESFKELPRTIANSLSFLATESGNLFFKEIPAAAGRILREIFGAAAAGLGFDLGLGALLAIGFGLWYVTKGKNHGEE